VLNNGLGRYAEACAAAKQAASNTFEPWFSTWSLPELVEAAARSGDGDLAHDALERLVETTQPAGTAFAFGVEARSRAMVASGEDAEQFYQDALDQFGRTQLRPELAHSHLVYGEWLRREGRRVDAREQLRTAYELCTAIGMEAFGERARRELVATGEHVRKRSVEAQGQLTPQELQIARLASEGNTNPEIGAQLFLSRRTVEWHLRKVFEKLEIRRRGELPQALSRIARRPTRT
jgi:DNA-binding CsgD family transcriptional regulator